VQVGATPITETRQTLATQWPWRIVPGARRYLDGHWRIECRHGDLRAKHRIGNADV